MIEIEASTAPARTIPQLATRDLAVVVLADFENNGHVWW